jgi:hypothetical protein
MRRARRYVRNNPGNGFNPMVQYCAGGQMTAGVHRRDRDNRSLGCGLQVAKYKDKVAVFLCRHLASNTGTDTLECENIPCRFANERQLYYQDEGDQ